MGNIQHSLTTTTDQQSPDWIKAVAVGLNIKQDAWTLAKFLFMWTAD